MFYAPSNGGFYNPEAKMPDDAVEITDALYQELKDAISQGRQILVNADGFPYVGELWPATVPMSVTMYQARAALINAELDQAVENAIESIEDIKARKLTRVAWEYAATVDRNSQFTQVLAAALGLTDEQLDDLLIAAAKVQ